MRNLWFAFALTVIPAIAIGLTVDGNDYTPSVTAEGKELKLVGAGTRVKWFFNVYSMAAYAETAGCDTTALITRDETKMLRINMLRDVSAEKMAATLAESFDKRITETSPAELKTQVSTLKSYFKDECSKGTSIEFTYVPGKGTSIKQNGKELGPVMTGKPFADTLWDIYFGADTCCPKLKKGIKATCK